MLTSHTSSEEEKIPYLQKFAQTTRKNNECPQLLENTADQHACYHKLWERRPQVPDLINSSPPSPPPRTGLSISLEELFHSQCWIVLLQFYYKEGIENKLTRAPLLGLAKSIY